MLMERELEPLGWSRFEQVKHLGHVQVIADGHPLQSLHHEELGRERVRHIERKVTDRGKAATGKVGDRAEVSDEDAVGFRVLDELEETLLGRFLDAWCGQQDPG